MATDMRTVSIAPCRSLVAALMLGAMAISGCATSEKNPHGASGSELEISCPINDLRVSMPSVRVRENEYFDAALRRFKRACEKAGILTELRRREFYEKPTQERKRKKAAAIKRHMKRVSRDGMRSSR